jgi:ABC-type polysaccharide/polyol phosphate transport system ATPase subunit
VKPVVEVSHLRKRFRLPLDKSSTLKYRMTHWRSSSRYRDLVALDDISFDIPAGQFLGIAGPNGCGKSTLLKILCRIYKADAGYARVNGEFSAFLELGVGFNPELTARENIFLGGAMLGLTRAQLRDKVDEVLAFAELEEFAEQKLKNFSSGMQVRLAFSVAILGQTDLLVMDEVLAVGDASFQEKCFDTFSRYKREGKTIVLVSHNLASLEEYCDRVLLLDHGEIVADGPAAEVTATYQRMVVDHALAAERDLSTGVSSGDSSRTSAPAVQFLSARLRNGSGQNTGRFDTGTPMTIDMELRVNRDVGDFVCGMAIRRADGLLLAGTNTLMDNVTISRPMPGDKVAVRYTIDSLPLLAGGYIVQVSVHDPAGSPVYDWLDPAASFRINDMGGHLGMFEMRGRWEVEQEADVQGPGGADLLIRSARP